MTIKNKRIYNVENHVIGLNEGEPFFVATNDSEQIVERLKKVGFTDSLSNGERVLPKILGPVSRFNALGGFIRLTHLPKETYYITRLWEWEDWAGNHYSKIVYIPKERYQRQEIKPPSEEVTIIHEQDVAVALSRELTFSKEHFPAIKHIVNLFLELFGECRILKKDLTPILKEEIKRLNWQVLPPGEYPWSRVKDTVERIIKDKSPNRRAILLYRTEILANKGAKLIATGSAGFNGYLVFSTQIKDLFLLESLLYGNATYVLNSNWEQLSQLTKSEILSGDLHQCRIIHNDEWIERITKLLKTA